MLDVFAKYAVDLNAEVNGVWKSIDEAEFLIARSGNKEFSKALTEAYEKNQDKIAKKDDAADALAEKLMLGVFADTLILDWKNVGFKGKELPYSRANVIMLLGVPEMKDFKAKILSLSDDVENFRIKQEAEQTKN